MLEDAKNYYQLMSKFLYNVDNAVLDWDKNFSQNTELRNSTAIALEKLHLGISGYKKLSDEQYLALVSILDMSYGQLQLIFGVSKSALGGRARKLGVHKTVPCNTSPIIVDAKFCDDLIESIKVTCSAVA